MAKLHVILPLIVALFPGAPALAKESGDDPSRCVAVSPGTGFEVNGQRFVISNETFAPGDDVDARIKQAYGKRAELANWQVLKKSLVSHDELRRFISDVGIPLQTVNGPCYNFLVANIVLDAVG